MIPSCIRVRPAGAKSLRMLPLIGRDKCNINDKLKILLPVTAYQQKPRKETMRRSEDTWLSECTHILNRAECNRGGFNPRLRVSGTGPPRCLPNVLFALTIPASSNSLLQKLFKSPLPRHIHWIRNLYNVEQMCAYGVSLPVSPYNHPSSTTTTTIKTDFPSNAIQSNLADQPLLPEYSRLKQMHALVKQMVPGRIKYRSPPLVLLNYNLYLNIVTPLLTKTALFCYKTNNFVNVSINGPRRKPTITL